MTYELTQGAMVALSAAVSVLFALTLALAAYALSLRIAYERRQRLWARLSAAWEEPVLAAITDPDRVDDVHAAVPEKYGLFFVNFVLDYSQRLRGEELEALRAIAQPYLGIIARRASHRRPEVRLRSVQTLGVLGLPRYEAEVVAALDDSSRSVAIVALRSLADARYSAHSRELLDHVERFEGWDPHFLGSMLAEVGPALSEALRSGLADASRPTWLRCVFAVALRLQLEPRGADVAAEVLPEADDLELRVELLRLLRELGRPEHVPVVLPFTSATDFAVRAHAMQVLGVLGDDRVVSTLLAALDDPSPWVRARAAGALLAVGGRKLLADVATAEPRYRKLVGQVLGGGGS